MNSAIPTASAPEPAHSTRTVWGTGLIALDIVFDVRTPHLRQYRAGGTCGNVLTILSYLGWNSCPISRLNGDSASLCVQDDFRQWGLSLEFVKLTPSAETPTIVQRIEHNRRGTTHSFSWQCPDCGRELPRYKPIQISSARQILPHLEDSPPQVFFMDRVSRGALILAKRAKEKGALIILEPCAVGNAKLFSEALDLCDIVKYSHDRLASLQVEGLENGPVLEIRTLGSQGLKIRKRRNDGWSEWQQYTAFPVSHVVDTAGAGDWFTAGLVHKLTRSGPVELARSLSEEIEEAIRYGQALSAWCCGFEGPRGGMYATSRQTFEETISAIATHQKWDQNAVESLDSTSQETERLPTWHCQQCGRSSLTERSSH